MPFGVKHSSDVVRIWLFAKLADDWAINLAGAMCLQSGATVLTLLLSLMGTTGTKVALAAISATAVIIGIGPAPLI